MMKKYIIHHNGKENKSHEDIQNLADLQGIIVEKNTDGKKKLKTRRDFLKKLGTATAGALILPASKVFAQQDTLASPDFGGPTEVVVGGWAQKTGTPGDYVYTEDDTIAKVSIVNGAGESSAVQIPADGIFWIKGESVGNTNIHELFSGDVENITVTEATPITLEKFEEIDLVDGKYPRLRWTTASELNNDYFKVERSIDGKSFEEIGTIPSKAENGTSPTRLEYEYTDHTEGLNGTVYYRFIQVDKNGKETVYNIKSVYIENIDRSPRLSPNPVSQGRSVNLEIFDKKNTRYSIVNINGQVVKSGDLTQGTNTLDLSDFPSGIYNLQVIGARTMKLIIVY